MSDSQGMAPSAVPVPFVGLCRAEWTKARGRGLGPAILLFGMAHGILAALGVKGIYLIQQQAAEGGRGMDPGIGPGPHDPFDLLVAGEVALHLAVFPVNGFALLLLASVLWAEDFSLGTLAMIFARPVSRVRVFAAKAAVLVLATAASVTLALCAALGIGAFLFGFSADLILVENLPWVGWMAGEPGALSRCLRLASGVLAGTVLMMPALGLAALLAVITRSPVLTLFGTGILLVGDFFVFLGLSGWGKANFDSSELAALLSECTLWSGRAFFPLHGPGTILSEGLGSLAVSGGYAVLFSGLALWGFVRRDVT